MPLLGRKIFSLAKPLDVTDSSETIYTISHTKEQFRSKDEYEKRVALYKDYIWTCQCTGHINLTHQQASESEETSKNSLRQAFLPCYEKTVLELVHHSTESLDNLVDKTWTTLQQAFVIDEMLMLKVKAGGKVIKGTVTKIEKTTSLENAASNCSSPSSDKENTNTNSEAQSGTPKKWTPPKLHPYKYCIKLEGGDKIINSIPAEDLSRADRPPSKDLLKLFIRTNALRPGTGSQSPWVVEEELVKKYGIQNKFAALFVSPLKMAELGRKSMEASAKKRKSKSKSTEPAAKKSKKSKDEKEKGKKKQKSVSPKKKATPKKNSTPVDVDSDSSDDDLTLAQVKRGDTPKKTPKSPKVVLSKLKMDVAVSDDSDSDLFTLASIKQGTPKKLSSAKKSSPKKGLTTPKKGSSKKSTKSPGKQKSNEKTPTKNKKKKQGMKQMTLFDLKKKGPSSGTPKKSPGIKMLSPPRVPRLALKLRKAIKDEKPDLIKQLITKAARELTAKQRENLPDDVKGMIVERYDLLEHKRKMKNMTPEQKAEYLKEKKNKEKAVRRARKRELKKKVEDQELDDLQPLPMPKIVPTPDSLPNECFGDVAMVTEFLRCFGGLLMPEDEYPIYSDALMKALVSGKEGFVYLSRAVTTLLQTLLQDEIAEDYKELGVQLSSIPVNQYTASELVRLCLRKHDSEDHSESDSQAEDQDEMDYEEVSEDLIEQLETCEFFELKPEEKLQILSGLCHRILGSYSVQDYMEDRQRDASTLWREKNAELKQKNDQLRAEKQKRKEEKKNKEETKGADENGEKKVVEKDIKNAEGMKPLSFYGQKEEQEEEPVDMASVVKRRRVNAAKLAEEKKEREKVERERRELEYAEARKERDWENFQKKFDDGLNLAKKVLRQGPIGTDRNHSRYWVFHHTTPGVYIEKGWTTRDIDYSYTLPAETSTQDTSAVSDDLSEDQAKTGTELKEKESVETTTPHFGQNLWFTYDSLKDIDALLESLHSQGYREAALKVEIQKRYDDVCKAVRAMQRTNLELRDCDGEADMLAAFRQELLDTEIRLRSGGLGGVEKFEEFEETITKTSDVKTLGELLIETKSHVAAKFLEGVMGKKKPKVKVEDKPEDDEEGNAEEAEDEDKVPEGTQKWIEAVQAATTLSRLHVLLGIFDSCVRWEKSAENAKCKICRRKGSDDKLLLCDDCNLPFHIFCLRPALNKIPDGDWFCPACIPDTQRRRAKVVNYRTLEVESEEEDEVVEEHESECAVCGGEDDLVECARCPCVYHIDCHNPPLRHAPRGVWVCNPCKTGKGRSRGRNARNKRPAPKVVKSVYTEYSSSDESTPPPKKARASKRVKYTEESTDDDEEERPTRGRSRNARAAARSGSRSSSRSHKKTVYTEESSEEAEEEEEEDEEDETPTRGGSRVKRGAARSRRKTNESEDSEDSGHGDMSQKLEKCQELLTRIIKHRSSWAFRDPVDEEEVPDYYQIIKKPMNLHTMSEKFDTYKTMEAFVSDMKLIMDNSFEYNHFSSEVGRATQVFEKHVIDLLKNLFPWYSYSRGPVVSSNDTQTRKSRR